MLVFITSCLESVVVVKAKEIECERFGDYKYFRWGFSIYSLKTCYLNGNTTIGEANVKISKRDETVLGFFLDRNKKVFHLPIGVAESFPNLQGYSAGACSIKEISHENFENLTKLKSLWLNGNQIRKILENTFDDLVEVERISLCN